MPAVRKNSGSLVTNDNDNDNDNKPTKELKMIIIIETAKNIYSYAVDEEESHNVYAESLFDIYAKTVGSDDREIDLTSTQIQLANAEAQYNDDLGGFVIVFNDGKQAQTQLYTEQNRLHADYGDTYIERYTDYDDELSEDQSKLVDEFVSQINKIICIFGMIDIDTEY